VRGAIARDEEQIVVRLTSGKQITVVAATVAAPPPGDIVVTVEERQPQSVTACNLAKLPQEKLTIERDGQKETYSGISLAAVLRHTGVTLGHEARDRYLTRYVLVTSSDGYRALLSIGEVDPYLRKSHVLLADKLDGRPLDPSDGPWRLIIPDDVRRRRWVRAVERIEVRYADVSHTPP
jgi:hypothetical protein